MLRDGGVNGYTVNWYPLGPVNEQLRSAEDAWLRWVREEVETRAALERALADAESAWQANKPASYEFTVNVECTCPTSFRVTAGHSEQIGDEEPVGQRHDRYDTVEDLFAEVRRLIALKPVRLLVRYDRELGYPVSIEMATPYLLDRLTVSVRQFVVR
jgi:hypothetical protein